ncbi:MAG: dihydrodipicolinate synthase family protein [Lautropia sp.]
MATNRIRGVVAAVATPVDPDYRPDLERLVGHCRTLLDRGCDAINLLGTTGEATAFGVEQRLDTMRAIAAAGLPLDRFMVGTGVCALEETVRLTRAACEIGYAGTLVLPPFYYPDIQPDGLLDYVSALHRRVSNPKLAIYLYHIPQNTGVAWPVDVVAELKRRHPAAMVGLKDSSGDIGYAKSVVAALDDFDVFPSSEATLSGANDAGFAGCISATVNLTSVESQAAWAGQGTDPGATAARQASALRAVFVKFPLVSAVKAALAARYDDPAWARVCPPLCALTEDAAADLGRMLAEIGKA